ncbi:hypothetical protein DQ237_00630 [Blastococcus sp. TF02-8]|uniref:hypothetical protein n=1 Tax=Blastococcus sp. TF02-8 TaxID=2250574 RepID=UPI000DFA0F3C|nr:hypothetical protein [Blastococcus sp. TF02-8]RBY97496.1 hypothetical protein DQ237_00630 [Blastococcus sp. TF02-8]
MPRVTTWKVPVGLWLSGLVAKIVLSLAVSETVGSWVGGTLGLLALVSGLLLARERSRKYGTERE